jgi:hypothetical protein
MMKNSVVRASGEAVILAWKLEGKLGAPSD